MGAGCVLCYSFQRQAVNGCGVFQTPNSEWFIEVTPGCLINVSVFTLLSGPQMVSLTLPAAVCACALCWGCSRDAGWAAWAAWRAERFTIHERWNMPPLPRRLLLSEAAKGRYWLKSHSVWARGKYSLEQWNKQMTIKCIICYSGICCNISQSNSLLHTSNV